MKKILYIIFHIFPILAYTQSDGFRCGNEINSTLNSISLRQKIISDTVINGNTIWVYPYSYKNENYLILSDKMRDGSYNAYYFDGITLAFTVTYKNRKAEGVINSYYKSGSLRGTRINHKGKPVGPFTSYHPNGKISKTGSYKKGKLDGVYNEYWNDGTIRLIRYYDMGACVGLYTEYYVSGRKKMEGTYVNNKKNGEWRKYSEDETQITTQYYENDVLIRGND